MALEKKNRNLPRKFIDNVAHSSHLLKGLLIQIVLGIQQSSFVKLYSF